jgi:hypothetical protein
MAVGPARTGRPTLSLDVGWLRSGLRFDLGLAHRLDLVARVDTMLLYDGVSGQNGGSLGLRATPFLWNRARLSAEGTLGQIFAPTDAWRGTFTVLRGELAAGVNAGPALLSVRGAVRALRVTAYAGTVWTHDEEAGAGVEARRGRWMAGAEAYALARPNLDTLLQWRVRLGLAL